MSALSSLIESPTRVLFFTGKGGMGKTTLACATAVALARRQAGADRVHRPGLQSRRGAGTELAEPAAAGGRDHGP